MKNYKLIGQGRTAEVYEIDNDRVIKIFYKNIPKKIIEYEYEISKILSGLKLPIVNTYDLIEIEDKYGIVYEKISGISMMEKIKPWNLKSNAKMMARLHNKIHIDIYNDIYNYKEILTMNIDKTNLLDINEKNKLKAYINKLPDGNCLCHGDYHPDNIIISDNRDYIIDWLTASKGNPLCDVARTIVLFEYAILPDNISSLKKFIMNCTRKHMIKIYTKEYLKLTGHKKESIDNWKVVIAAARLYENIPQKEKLALIEFVREEMKEKDLNIK